MLIHYLKIHYTACQSFSEKCACIWKKCFGILMAPRRGEYGEAVVWEIWKAARTVSTMTFCLDWVVIATSLANSSLLNSFIVDAPWNTGTSLNEQPPQFITAANRRPQHSHRNPTPDTIVNRIQDPTFSLRRPQLRWTVAFPNAAADLSR